MKKRYNVALTIITILAFSMQLQASACQSNPETSPDNSWSSAATMMIGAGLGISEGILSRVTDHIWPFNWILLHQVKKLTTQAIIDDAQKNGQGINESLLKDSVWLSSWISYLIAFDKIKITSAQAQTTYIVLI